MSDSPIAGRPGVFSADTTAEAERVQVEVWRRMSSIDKASLISDATRTVEALALSGVRLRHPEASERECFLRVASLKLGPALVRLVYPDAAQIAELG